MGDATSLVCGDCRYGTILCMAGLGGSSQRVFPDIVVLYCSIRNGGG